MASRNGVDLAPQGSVAAMLHNAATGWGYNQHDPQNQMRAQSLRLRNLVDDALADYLRQLRNKIGLLRKGLPEPTREQPFAPREQLDAIADCEEFVRSVESLRVSVQGLPMPTKDIVWRGKGEHVALLDRLRGVDLELFTALLEPDDEVVETIHRILHKRDALLKEYIAWGS